MSFWEKHGQSSSHDTICRKLELDFSKHENPGRSCHCSMTRPSRTNPTRWTVPLGLCLLSSLAAFSQKATVMSPNQRIVIALHNQQDVDTGEWFLKADYVSNGKTCEAIPQIHLGPSRSDQDFANDLRCVKAGKPTRILDQYSALHGKRAQCSDSANQVVSVLKTRQELN